jgi:hypothetical protein
LLRIDSGDLAEAEATSSCKRAKCHFRVLSSEGKGAREAGWLVSGRYMHSLRRRPLLQRWRLDARFGNLQRTFERACHAKTSYLPPKG